MKSNSDKIREKGNEYFKKADINKFNLLIIKERVHTAINYYEDALRASNSKDEKYKALKNIHLSYKKILDKMIYVNHDSIDEILFYSKYSVVQGLLTAQNIPEKDVKKQPDLRPSFIANIYVLINTILQYLTSLKLENEIKYFLEFERHLLSKNDMLSFLIYEKLSKKFLSIGINEIQDKSKEIRKSRCLSYFNSSLEFALKAQKNLSVFSKIEKEFVIFISKVEGSDFLDREESINDLISSSNFYLNRVNGHIQIEIGNEYFKKGVFDEESLDMECIYHAIDKYRESITVKKIFDSDHNIDIEIECLALFNLGKIWHKIFKNNSKAKELIMEAMRLAQLLHVNLMQADWYSQAFSIIEVIRLAEEAENNSDKQKYLDELKPVLTIIEEESKKSIESFLKFLVKNHPHKENFQYDVDKEIKDSSQKKVVQKFCMFYHPDKIISDDKLYKVKMEEISKILNSKYEYFKGD